MSDTDNMKVFADQLWNYLEPKVKSLLSSSVGYFRAQVVSNPGDGTLILNRPLESNNLTIPCTNAMAGAAAGQQVTVLVLGSLSNAVVVADGRMNFTL